MFSHGEVDVLPRPLGGDSFCKTATSRREDVLRGVDVTVMDRSALATNPSSYSKTCGTFRATAHTARRTGLGRKHFANFGERYSCESAFIPEHRPKCRPARVEHRLSVRCFDQRGGVYVANENRAVFAHETSRELMQGVLPAMGDFCMNRTHSILLAGALRRGELNLKPAIELRGGKLLPGAGGDQILEPKVDT